MQEILDAQLQSVDLVQRQAGGAKVCFYYPQHCVVPKFGNVADEAHVATVVVSDSESPKASTMRVELFVVNGRFFSMEFPKRPDRYLEQHHIDVDRLRVVSAEIHGG